MELIAQKREIFGKKLKSFRKQGLIPAELYGKGIKNIHLFLNKKEFIKVFKEAGENTIITLNLGSDRVPAMIFDIDRDPLSGDARHVDLYQVNLKEKIRVNTPLIFKGVSPAVKAGGVLIKSMHEVEVEALPTDVPRGIEIDLTKLANIGDSIYVKDLPVPANTEIKADPDTVVASVIEKAEEEISPKETELDLSAIKTESEEKKEAKKAAEKEAEEAEGKPSSST